MRKTALLPALFLFAIFSLKVQQPALKGTISDPAVKQNLAYVLSFDIKAADITLSKLRKPKCLVYPDLTVYITPSIFINGLPNLYTV